MPANGLTKPIVPKVRKRAAAIHVAEPVRWYREKLSAMYAAAPPVIEMSLATARRRTGARDRVTMDASSGD